MMNYKQELNKTVQWNTHEMSGGVPVFAFDTKQSYRPSPMDNTLNQGGYDNVNPNVFRQALGIDQISAIITQDILPRLTRLQTYPQPDNSASARSDADIWNNINQEIFGKSGAESSPKGNWAANPNALLPRIQRNRASITSMENQHVSFQNQLTDAKEERVAIQTKLDNKAMLNHTHTNYGGKTTPVDTEDSDEDCGWFGEKCLGKNIGGSLLPSISATTLAAVGIGAYLLTRKK
tara:strand:+ start:78 stop:782 length:705 start_codon:yes stop_codon:yes gene_type:complete